MKLPMKLLRTAGLCLVAMCVMGMAMAGTAAAVERVWEHCQTEKEAGPIPTKYSEHQCTTAMSGGKWAWRTVENTEKVVTHGSLVLKDLKVPIEGTVEVQCTGEDVGSVGPKTFDRIESITNIQCAAGKGCEKLEGNAEPRNIEGIGWQTALEEPVAGEIRDKITNGKTGKEAPGWAVTCRVLGVTETDVCTVTEGSTKVENKATPGVEGSLLVLTTFEAKSPKANCTVGGEKEGEVLGTIANLQANGWGLRVS